MSLVNTTSRQIHYKLIYWGPAASGKTTSLRFIQQRSQPKHPQALRTWPDKHGRTAFFDQISLAFGTRNGLEAHVHVVGTPGADMYIGVRSLLLPRADGIVFVADSRPEAQAANQLSFRELQTLLQTHDLSDVPVVLQYNHRDAADALAVETMSRQWGRALPYVESNASTGSGVLSTLKMISDLVLVRL